MTDDDGKLNQKLLNKIINAKKEGVECLLTLSEVEFLLESANLKSSDWGFSSGNNYVLGRYKDSGNYEIGNCAFITQSENLKEQNLSDKKKIANDKNRIKGLESLSLPENKEKWRKSFDSYLLRRKIKAEEDRKIKEMFMDQNKIGQKNSQFGSFWINNGFINKKWKEEKGQIPEGFVKGRINVVMSWLK